MFDSHDTPGLSSSKIIVLTWSGRLDLNRFIELKAGLIFWMLIDYPCFWSAIHF